MSVRRKRARKTESARARIQTRDEAEADAHAIDSLERAYAAWYASVHPDLPPKPSIVKRFVRWVRRLLGGGE